VPIDGVFTQPLNLFKLNQYFLTKILQKHFREDFMNVIYVLTRMLNEKDIKPAFKPQNLPSFKIHFHSNFV
jgi:hypothetical protein